MVFSINFSEEKNQVLKATRGVCFDDVIDALELNQELADISHPNNERSNQKVYVVRINNYAYAVPYTLDRKKKEIFLKTVYPSRVLTKKYLKEGGENEKKDV